MRRVTTIDPVKDAKPGEACTEALAAAVRNGGCDAGLVRAFDLLGKRWNGVILGALQNGPAGFADLRRSVGAITDSMLSDRLGELAAAGLIARTVTETRPPGVSYALTDAGSALVPILSQLAGWAGDHLAARS
jgi:DNA-binding HxlR family transcriptional regulator